MRIPLRPLLSLVLLASAAVSSAYDSPMRVHQYGADRDAVFEAGRAALVREGYRDLRVESPGMAMHQKSVSVGDADGSQVEITVSLHKSESGGLSIGSDVFLVTPGITGSRWVGSLGYDFQPASLTAAHLRAWEGDMVAAARRALAERP